MTRIVLYCSLALGIAQGEEDIGALERRMVELVNVEREARGLPVLAAPPALSAVAREHSAKMAASGEVSHEASGMSMEERIRSAAPDTCFYGENLSKNTSLEYALTDLMLSEDHRKNLLNARFTRVGVGIARDEDGNLYITQNFARPCQKPPRIR